MARSTVNTVLGIALIVVGVLLVLGSLTVESALKAVLPYLGIALIVLGILILVKVVPGGLLIGIAVLVVGILFLEGFIRWSPDVRDIRDDVMRVINIVAGVVLVIVGIGRLRGN